MLIRTYFHAFTYLKNCFVQGMNEACINEAIEDTTDGIYVLKQHASDEPEDVGVVVLKGIKGLVHPKMKILSLTIDSSTVESQQH